MPQTTNKVGRPTSYTQELADDICQHLSMGESLRKTCSYKGMPDVKTIFNWFRTQPEFLQQYTRAKEESADAMAEDVLYISDAVKVSTEAVAKAKLRIETRKWLMAKMKPKKFGEKIDVNSTGEIVHKWGDMDDEELERALKARQDRAT